MHRTHRAIASLAAPLILLAACSAPGSGAGGSETGEPVETGAATASSMPSGSAPASAGTEAGTGERVQIGDIAADPASYTDREVTVLARVDALPVDGQAFITSPSGTDENQLLVVLAGDAQVNKEIEVSNVVWVGGTIVPFTNEGLQAAGAGVTADAEALADYDGDYVIVANHIDDPLAGDDAEDAD